VTQHRKTTVRKSPSRSAGSATHHPQGPSASAGARPLSARSVIASTLLGVQPPRLPGRLLVASGEIFGISEGTTRVALSRMVANGELVVDEGTYQLAGRLLERQDRQLASRRARHRSWTGAWELVVVTAERRDAASRAALRDAVRRMKLAELREGVWIRPDNLDPDRSPDAAALVAQQCRRFVGAPDHRAEPDADDDRSLAASLWDLDGWARAATAFQHDLERSSRALTAHDTAEMAPAFVLSAAVLRHLLADPELPDELVPDAWPGPALRAAYDDYDATFKAVWRDWFRAQA
jgi:phenylacetic acid degradation operon negative regulatory protein